MYRAQRPGDTRKRVARDLVLAGVDSLLQTRPLYELGDGEEATTGMEEGENATESEEALLFSPSSLLHRPSKRPRGEMDRAAAGSSPPPSLLFESLDSSDGLGGTEMELLSRKEEETADMILFLAAAFTKQPSLHNLCELLEVFARVGMADALRVLKRSGTTESFLSLLLSATAVTAADDGGREAIALDDVVLHFLSLVAREADLEVFCCPPIIAALVRTLDGVSEVTACSAASQVPPSLRRHPNGGGEAAISSPPPRRHWADIGAKKASPRKRVSPADAAAQDLTSSSHTRLQNVLERLFLADALHQQCDAVALVLQLLLDLVLRQNQRGGELPESACAARLFAASGGLRSVGDLIDPARMARVGEGSHRVTRDTALSFLEVVTSSAQLGDEEGLRDVAHKLVQTLSPLSNSSADYENSSRSLEVIVLRILTNITGISPRILAEADRISLGAVLRHFIMSCWAVSSRQSQLDGSGVGEAEEREVFSLCCAVNVIKWENKASRHDLISSLLLGAGADDRMPAPDCDRAPVEALLDTAASAMMACYTAGQTEDTVRSGYYALFLGVASLAAHPGRDDGSLRVPVLAAVAKATRASALGEVSGARPMAVVVAIIQEFLFFQSSSGTLTKDTLVEMHGIVESLVSANKLDVSSC